MRKQLYSVSLILSVFLSVNANAQYPNRCSDISTRSNSNGLPNACAGSPSSQIASNFANTPYAAIPATAKTADITFKYLNTDASTLKPFAITKISVVNGCVTTILNSQAGPAEVPKQATITDASVKYCIYTNNIPTAGTLILELTNPETRQVVGSCSYDAACTSECVTSTNIILPVRITDFTAKRNASQVILKWTTEEESSIQSYEVERSQNGVQFEKMGAIASRNITAANAYAYTDGQPASTNYYRLKIIHATGGFEYSKTIQVKNPTAYAVIESITPNPFRGEVTVTLSLPKSQFVTIQLLDFTGREIKQVKTTASAGTNKISLDNLSNLPNGGYVVRIQTETGIITQKITK